MSEHAPNPTATSVAGRHRYLTDVFEMMARSLGPFIDEQMSDYFSGEPSWLDAAANRLGRPTEHGTTDPLFQLLLLRRFWGPVFADRYGSDLRNLISQLIEARNLWAHFNLPDDLAELDPLVLAAERLVAPIDPTGAKTLRTLRTELNSTAGGREASESFRIDSDEKSQTLDQPKRSPQEAIEADPLADKTRLAKQLSETERVFDELQHRYSTVETDLEESKQAALHKQLKLQAIERELTEINGRSEALALHLAQERSQRNRIEWLFVGLIAALLLAMLFMG